MAMDVDVGAGSSDFDELNSDEPPPKKKAPAKKAPAKAPAKTKAPAKKAPAKGKGKKVQVKSIAFVLFNFSTRLKKHQSDSDEVIDLDDDEEEEEEEEPPKPTKRTNRVAVLR